MDSIATIKSMVQDAERHADAMSQDRIRATEYYQGVMKDTPTDENRSKMVKRVVRAQIKKVLPSLMRTLLGSSRIAEFLPVGEGDEDEADQKTDYFSSVVAKEADLHRTVEDAIHDALLLRNGIVRWWWDEKIQVRVSQHTGITDEAMTVLVADPDVEVLEHSEYEEMVEADGQQMPVLLHDLKIRRYEKSGKPMSAAVPRERFLIHPDATCIQDSSVTGVKDDTTTRSDLVAMGYDKDLIYSLPVEDDEDEDDVRREEYVDTDEAHKANEKVTYYDLYVRFDADDDGIAELRHMCFAGGLNERNLLLDEECDEVQFADIKVMSQPHQWEGIALSDDLLDLQQAETVLLRQTLDNLYWQNNPQPAARRSAVANWDAVLNPEFGKPIEVNEGFGSVREAVDFLQVPFFAEKSFGMLNYLDDEATERTGVSDASSGLAPDALQNMTAKASAMIEQAGIGQTEMMVRTAAVGIERLCAGLMRLCVRHQDVPRIVRLRGQWVEVDPRHWQSEMDVEVNVGLGAGTRERDTALMQMVIGLQEKVAATLGPDNPFVKPEHLHNALSRFIEAAGLKTPDLYFAEPDPEEVAARQQQPNPEVMKAQADAQLEQQKMQVQIAREKAQMEADLEVEKARIQANTISQKQELESKLAIKNQEISWEREKLERTFQHEMALAEQKRQDEVAKAQAEGFSQMLEAAE